MPNITISGIKREDAIKMADIIGNIVVEKSGTNPIYKKVFYSPIERIDGDENPAIDIYWMHREQEICDKVSKHLTEYLRSQGYSNIQITFTEFPGNLFYDDGTHY
ncbi:MAG: DUF1904 family protein [Tissierellia bacterium]|jgi:hypothetical protein|nr:DUF1904 family protein [Tissierellia bacterium]